MKEIENQICTYQIFLKGYRKVKIMDINPPASLDRWEFKDEEEFNHQLKWLKELFKNGAFKKYYGEIAKIYGNFKILIIISKEIKIEDII